MKFSVLLPTRNRLEFLKYAVASVLQQDEQDYEIIISDNCSDEDIEGYVRSLKNERIKYFRTSHFVSVTENWNNALNKSCGEWVIMLGDDDCLMQGYFSTIRQLLEKFPDPDFIYTNGFIFTYPGVSPLHPQGLAHTYSHAEFVTRNQHPFWLSKEEALKLVKETFNFTVVFAFNMQFATISRSFIEKLKIENNFFYSPYPDYYAMTTMMLFGERILSCPFPIVTVGVSPKSFGFYYFNNIETKGLSFLNNSKEKLNKLDEIILPGTDMNNSWLLSLEAIKSNFKTCRLPINYTKYRQVQIIAFYRQIIDKSQENKVKFLNLYKQLGVAEKLLFGAPWYLLMHFPRFFRKIFLSILSRLIKSHKSYPTIKIPSHFENIQEFFEKTNPFNFNVRT